MMNYSSKFSFFLPGREKMVTWSVPEFILVTNLTFGALPPLFYWRRKKKFLLFFLSHVDNVFFQNMYILMLIVVGRGKGRWVMHFYLLSNEQIQSVM